MRIGLARPCLFFLFPMLALPAVSSPQAAPAQPATQKQCLQQALVSYRAGDWDACISAATQGLDMRPAPAGTASTALRQKLEHVRGTAACHISSFRTAAQDLLDVSQAASLTELPDPASSLSLIKQIRSLRPALEADVVVGDKLRFRVYYDAPTAWTQKVIAMLPDAYTANLQLLGLEARDVPVLLFTDHSKFVQYVRITTGHDTPDFAAACTCLGSILVPQTNGLGTAIFESKSPVVNTLLVHELNHRLMQKLWGTGHPPQWFIEGLAQMAEAHSSGAKAAVLQQRFDRCRQAGLLLSAAEMNDDAVFESITQRGFARAGIPDADSALEADPYAQGYAMTRALVNSLPADSQIPFLKSLRSQNFSEALFQFQGQSLQEFEEKWSQHAATTGPY
jgi:hypothetical protein